MYPGGIDYLESILGLLKLQFLRRNWLQSPYRYLPPANTASSVADPIPGSDALLVKTYTGSRTLADGSDGVGATSNKKVQ